MKVFHNIFKHISSSHQDKHSDQVNNHQHHGKVDKKHRSKIVEIDKLDKHSQIDNDLGLHIIYFLQHGRWKVNEYSSQGNDSNLLIVFYVQIMPDDFVMQLHRF